MGIASLLLQQGLISRVQVDRAVAEQRASGERFDKVAVRLGYVTREQVLSVLGEQFHMPIVDLTSTRVEPEVLATLPAKLVHKQSCVPIARRDGVLTVATSDPFEISVLDELKLLTGCTIDVVLADEEELRGFIAKHYGVGASTLDEMVDSAGDEAAGGGGVAAGGGDEIEQAQEASVIKLVNDLLAEAIADRATDVHFEPYERELIVRYRIDGVLQRANVPATIHRFAPAILSRLKIMANLNVAEKRAPQDGRITLKLRGQEFDLRVSVIPMLFGEGVVLRVLSKSAVMLGLDQLGMPPGVLGAWDGLIQRPHGILLVTGPTGSGKSTTLYASLNRIVSDEIKAITVEDPVEYHVPGVNQIQVNAKVGLDFSAGLRSILRHDPDVVLVGEIRDKETAETAVQASLTGHLVFSTLHTNDAASATTRLLNMGVEPFLVSSSVEGILAQRLVRRVCEQCAQRVDAAEVVRHAADYPAGFVPTGAAERAGLMVVRAGPEGCRACRATGYRGRVGIYELLRMSDAIRELVLERAPGPRIAGAAEKEGLLMTLREDGFTKARAGQTTVEEVVSAIAT
ncbi:MAG: Flp pilus assembly complex ATPase component TadA [Phycisphaerae bacterium]|nr:Flp pilus assembly complex ATPase component TadA [Phycisphaerae bacterium]